AYRGRTVATNPPPSSGGVLILHSLGVLERLAQARDGWAGSSVLRLLGALRSAQAQRTPAFERSLYRGGAVARVLDPALLDAAAASLAPAAREPAGARGTTQVSVIDADGNAASMTSSTGSGSGFFAPGTGVHLNNMLGESDLVTGAMPLRTG